MDRAYVDSHSKRRLQEAKPHLVELVATVMDCAELATLAVAVPDTLAIWGINSRALELGFREVVRDRYRELTQAQVTPGR
jgi:hypothetical protein